MSLPSSRPRPKLYQAHEEVTGNYKPGSKVRHKRFGEGEVKDCYGDVALVHFASAGDKKLKINFLTAR
ncbi:hypothetical protein [Granulicella arctica]|uniref:hypothetical protein n=1 Tax=Granulicella arctica TaxID=940613 RepID=UPI0021E0D2E9|nr:hypothetical protein [Granulicella arctica]